MPRFAQDYEKKLINLRSGDAEKLKQHFPQFAYSAIVRSLVEQFVDSLEQGKQPVIQFNPNRLDIK